MDEFAEECSKCGQRFEERGTLWYDGSWPVSACACTSRVWIPAEETRVPDLEPNPSFVIGSYSQNPKD